MKIKATGIVNWTWGSCLVAGVLLFLSSGCQSTSSITWDKPSQMKSLDKEVYINKAEWGSNSVGDNHSVGKHTFTLFAIPIKDISTKKPVDESITKAVMDTYEQAGFTVKEAKAVPDDTVVITPVIHKVKYWSYSWLWPLFFTGGEVHMSLNAQEKGGKRLWGNDYQEKSSRMTFGGCYGFDRAVKKDINKIITRMSADARNNSGKVPDQQAMKDAVPEAIKDAVSDSSKGKATARDTVERLKKLKELKETGVISDEEYEKKRNELVAQL